MKGRALVAQCKSCGLLGRGGDGEDAAKRIDRDVAAVLVPNSSSPAQRQISIVCVATCAQTLTALVREHGERSWTIIAEKLDNSRSAGVNLVPPPSHARSTFLRAVHLRGR